VSVPIVGGKFLEILRAGEGVQISTDWRLNMDRSGDSTVTLTAAEQQLFDRLGPLFEAERLRMARALATGPLFGAKEFELRDQVHELGAHALEVAADERQKKGRIPRS
jgi:hypothetical protein